MNNLTDTIAHLLFTGIFISPLIAFPIAWQIKKVDKVVRIIIGIFFALILSALCYYFWLSLFFKSYGSFE
jgi:hypothetical protein